VQTPPRSDTGQVFIKRFLSADMVWQQVPASREELVKQKTLTRPVIYCPFLGKKHFRHIEERARGQRGFVVFFGGHCTKTYENLKGVAHNRQHPMAVQVPPTPPRAMRNYDVLRRHVFWVIDN
jgi:hypothetical protein